MSNASGKMLWKHLRVIHSLGHNKLIWRSEKRRTATSRYKLILHSMASIFSGYRVHMISAEVQFFGHFELSELSSCPNLLFHNWMGCTGHRHSGNEWMMPHSSNHLDELIKNSIRCKKYVRIDGRFGRQLKTRELRAMCVVYSFAMWQWWSLIRDEPNLKQLRLFL